MTLKSMLDSPNDEKLSDFKLRIGYWFISHRWQFKNILLAALTILNVVLIGYSSYNLVNYFLTQSDYETMLRSIAYESIDYENFRLRHQPQKPQILEIEAVAAGTNEYDLIAKVKNINADWVIERLVYRFKYGSYQSEAYETFLLPVEEKYLILLDQPGTGGLFQLQVEIVTIDWRHLASFKIPDYKTYQAERADFFLKDVEFISASESLFQSGLDASRVIFEAKNMTIYGFWEVGFYIVLYRQDKIVGGQYIKQEQFEAGERRRLEVRWFDTLPNVTKVVVIPEVNILDEDIYIPLTSEAGELK